ncbi:SNF2-related protein [Rubritalea spongiae]|uniref:SNF2-related protein n=1 Tax=Rubritalea spongiae TaxID=430797 RepID=A0ABW5E1Q7_9BACT
MSSPLSLESISNFLASEQWLLLFSSSNLQTGQKIARSRKIYQVSAETLETGDVEIVSYVQTADGHQHECIIALWLENESIQIDASCSCAVQANCEHNAATLYYLTKGERLAIAFGQTPHMEAVEQGKRLSTPQAAPSSEKRDTDANNKDCSAPTFLLRVERKSKSTSSTSNSVAEQDIYASAYAVYSEHKVPLEPSGLLIPIVTPDGKITRHRETEMTALQTLYALDLLPKDPQKSPKQKKWDSTPKWMREDAPAGNQGKIWLPDNKQWPHPDFYWQRFRHEATPALESRSWEVQYSVHVGLKPLIFRAETWKAEMVEEAKGWFNLSAGFEIDGEHFEIQPILAALLANNFLEVTEGLPKGQEFMIFLPDGRGLALPVGRFRHILKTLGELLEFKFTEGPIKISTLDAALLADDQDIPLDVPENIQKISEQIQHPQSIEAVSVPSDLHATLREYQLHGFYWMQFLTRNHFGGILADDMGLGKTLQTLTHILAEKESNRSNNQPTLVLAPTSVVVNWQREAAKFAPTLKVLILQGAKRHFDFPHIASYDIVLTSYALIHRDLEHHLTQHYHLIALDEAQHIKNPGAQVSSAIRQLKSTHRLCLSGTPIENNLGELWSLFAFLMPGLLGERSAFNENYRSPIEKQNDQSKRDSLNRKVGPLILRRTKHDVAKELPPKTEILHTISLSTAQKDLYETVRAAMDKQVRQAIVARGGEAQIVFLDALLKLRQICCHPSLLNFESDQMQARAEAESAKMLYLIEMLETLREEGHRVLIFSQFTSMLEIIENHLNAQDISYLILTGATKDRQSLVERFQGGEGEVFLISLKAGGTGLTLTGADTVIHYDPWWNPAAENQATDRAYRIGQDKAVMVHKLICEGTVEERIQQMQAKKNTLADNILDGATQSLDLNEKTLSYLLSVPE